jgi:hypothetical protein
MSPPQSPKQRDAALVRESWNVIKRSRALLRNTAPLVKHLQSGDGSAAPARPDDRARTVIPGSR